MSENDLRRILLEVMADIDAGRVRVPRRGTWRRTLGSAAMAVSLGLGVASCDGRNFGVVNEGAADAAVPVDGSPVLPYMAPQVDAGPMPEYAEPFWDAGLQPAYAEPFPDVDGGPMEDYGVPPVDAGNSTLYSAPPLTDAGRLESDAANLPAYGVPPYPPEPGDSGDPGDAH